MSYEMSAPKSKRKPHNQNYGYVAELRIKDREGEYAVIYDNLGGRIVEHSDRWIVVREPKGTQIATTSLAHARAIMKVLARGDIDGFRTEGEK
jgi:hypothetical protein